MRVKINGTDFIHFNSLTIDLSMDKVASVFSFNVRFLPDNNTHRQIFKPLSFPLVQIYDDNNKLLLTGKIVTQSFKSNSKPNLVPVSGHSLPGILEKVTIPLRLYPLESINRSIKDITERLISAFGISLVVDQNVINQANTIISKSVASPSETIKSYLSKLTAQKNIVLSHNEKGQLRFFILQTKSSPVYFFTKENTTEMQFNINGQNFHSEVSVIRQPSITVKNVSLQDSVTNNLIGEYRPLVSVLSSGETTDTTRAAKNKLASELLSMPLTIQLNKVIAIQVGDLVEVQNDEVFLFKRTKFIVNSIQFSQNNNKENTSLSLVLPEAFTGDNPVNIFE